MSVTWFYEEITGKPGERVPCTGKELEGLRKDYLTVDDIRARRFREASTSEVGTSFGAGAEITDYPPYTKRALEIATLVTQKEKAYGRAWQKTEALLQALYPTGIPVEAYSDLLLTVRLLDKLVRMATSAGKDALGEDPREDIAGYALMLATKGRL